MKQFSIHLWFALLCSLLVSACVAPIPAATTTSAVTAVPTEETGAEARW